MCVLVLSRVFVVLSYRSDLSFCWFPVGAVLLLFTHSSIPFVVCPFVSVCCPGEACESVESIQSRCDLGENPLHEEQRPDGRCYRSGTDQNGCFDTEVLHVIVSLSIEGDDVVAVCCSLCVSVCVFLYWF